MLMPRPHHNQHNHHNDINHNNHNNSWALLMWEVQVLLVHSLMSTESWVRKSLPMSTESWVRKSLPMSTESWVRKCAYRWAEVDEGMMYVSY